MSHSLIGNKIRLWLGLNDLASKRLIASVEEANRTRHQETLNWVSGIHERLGKIENMFVDQHIRRKAVETYDWDQIQVQKLDEMMKNIPKDDYDT